MSKQIHGQMAEHCCWAVSKKTTNANHQLNVRHAFILDTSFQVNWVQNQSLCNCEVIGISHSLFMPLSLPTAQLHHLIFPNIFARALSQGRKIDGQLKKCGQGQITEAAAKWNIQKRNDILPFTFGIHTQLTQWISENPLAPLMYYLHTHTHTQK